MQEEKKYKLLIAGDLLPSGKNIKMFLEGDAGKVFGKKVCQMFMDAEYSIINLEGALTDSTDMQKKVDPILKAPIAAINGIKNLGVKAVALANNHVTDYCDTGYDDTIKTIVHAGIEYVGTGYNKKEIKTHLSICLGACKVCIYNVSETFFNVPGNNSAGCNLYDEWLVLNEIKELKKTHDYIVVIYHGGAEKFPYPTPMVRKRFHRMADCGADFITAQHTHCIGCEEKYQDSYLLYGQGNFLFARMKHPMTKEGLITEISFAKDDRKPCGINHYHIRVNERDVVEYDDIQDLSSFHERSREIQEDYDAIFARYLHYAYHNPIIKNRYLIACKGDGIVNKMLMRAFPKYYKNLCLDKYNQQQLLRLLVSHEGERYSEDYSACLRYMLFHNQDDR